MLREALQLLNGIPSISAQIDAESMLQKHAGVRHLSDEIFKRGRVLAHREHIHSEIEIGRFAPKITYGRMIKLTVKSADTPQSPHAVSSGVVPQEPHYLDPLGL